MFNTYVLTSTKAGLLTRFLVKAFSLAAEAHELGVSTLAPERLGVVELEQAVRAISETIKSVVARLGLAESADVISGSKLLQKV